MKRKTGFTLIELTVAVSLSMILTTGMFFFLGQGIRNWKKITQSAAATQVENIIAERITTDIRFGREIMAASGSEEVFIKNGAEIITYRLVSRKVRREKGAEAAYLTSEDEVSKLAFSYPAAGTVRVELNGIDWTASVND